MAPPPLASQLLPHQRRHSQRLDMRRRRRRRSEPHFPPPSRQEAPLARPLCAWLVALLHHFAPTLAGAVAEVSPGEPRAPAAYQAALRELKSLPAAWRPSPEAGPLTPSTTAMTTIAVTTTTMRPMMTAGECNADARLRHGRGTCVRARVCVCDCCSISCLHALYPVHRRSFVDPSERDDEVTTAMTMAMTMTTMTALTAAIATPMMTATTDDDSGEDDDGDDDGDRDDEGDDEDEDNAISDLGSPDDGGDEGATTTATTMTNDDRDGDDDGRRRSMKMIKAAIVSTIDDDDVDDIDDDEHDDIDSNISMIMTMTEGGDDEDGGGDHVGDDDGDGDCDDDDEGDNDYEESDADADEGDDKDDGDDGDDGVRDGVGDYDGASDEAAFAMFRSPPGSATPEVAALCPASSALALAVGRESERHTAEAEDRRLFQCSGADAGRIAALRREFGLLPRDKTGRIGLQTLRQVLRAWGAESTPSRPLIDPQRNPTRRVLSVADALFEVGGGGPPRPFPAKARCLACVCMRVLFGVRACMCAGVPGVSLCVLLLGEEMPFRSGGRTQTTQRLVGQQARGLRLRHRGQAGGRWRP